MTSKEGNMKAVAWKEDKQQSISDADVEPLELSESRRRGRKSKCVRIASIWLMARFTGMILTIGSRQNESLLRSAASALTPQGTFDRV
jgi:hypothetical protein